MGRHVGVLLLVLLDMLVSAALCSRRLHRRLPAELSAQGGTWPLLGAVFVPSAALAHTLAGSPLAVDVTVVQHALLVAVLMGGTPRGWRPVLAIYLCAAAGVNLFWALLAATGAISAVPFVAQLAVALTWQGLAIWAGLQHRRALHGH